MKIISANEIAVGVEQHLEINHRGGKYKWVGYMTENVSGYDWYRDGKRIEDPEWAEDLDMYDLWWEKYTTGKIEKCTWCNK
jgi:hypothetical protein